MRLEPAIARRPTASPRPRPVLPSPQALAAARRRAERERTVVITAHLALVDQIAAKLCARLPRQVDLDEIISAGHVGLVQAAASFDPDRGVPFGAFARRRIHGAMLDYLREIDPLTRHARHRERAGLEHHFEVQLHMDDPAHVRAHGLHALVSGAPMPDDVLAKALRSVYVLRAVARLPARERHVLEQYFWHQRLLGEIGHDLGVGEARASQLKKQGCDRLRRLLTC